MIASPVSRHPSPVQGWKLELAKAAWPGSASPETASFNKNRSYPLAKRGGSQNFQSDVVTTPLKKSRFPEMKETTHSKRMTEVDEQVCASKTRYETRQLAQSAIRGLVTRRGRARQKNLHSYQCPVCAGYHLTSH